MPNTDVYMSALMLYSMCSCSANIEGMETICSAYF